MARHYFGASMDVHAGGVDLVFPHHENEIAQSEAYFSQETTEEGGGGAEFCKHWVHNAFVNVDNEKMSKSLGNFVTLRGRFTTPKEVRAFKYLVVTSQYRTPLNFNLEALSGAQNALKKLDRFHGLIADLASDGGSGSESGKSGSDDAVAAACAAAVSGLALAMNDDLNTPRAAASLFGLLKQVQPWLNEKGALSQTAAREVQVCLGAFNAALGIFYDLPTGYFLTGKGEEADKGSAAADAGGEGAGIPAEVQALVEARTVAKDASDWGKADALRDAIKDAGFLVKDVKGGLPLVTPL